MYFRRVTESTNSDLNSCEISYDFFRDITMEDGIITGNNAAIYGGGVCFINHSTEPVSFTKTGGTIYGNEHTHTGPGLTGDNCNLVSSTDYGHAVFFASGADGTKIRNATAGVNENLSNDKPANWD